MVKLAGLCALALVASGMCAFCLDAQNSGQRGSAPPGAESAQSLPAAQNKIRVQTNEVVAAVTMLDKHGDLVLDLAQSDFHVFDNGVEQTIDRWDMGGDPLAVALVLETSSHIAMMAPVIHGMGSLFTETVMALNGEAAVITYDSTVEVRQPFTQDHDDIARAIGGVEFEAPEMRLYDAMAQAVELLKIRPTHYRRVMLIVGESQDIASDAKLGLVLREAELENIAIYAVGPSSSTADLRFGAKAPNRGISYPPGVFSGPTRPGALPVPGNGGAPGGTLDLAPLAVWLVTRGTNEIKNHQLEMAAAATGGVHYRAIRDRAVRSALDRIGSELHAQYVLSYRPAVAEQTAGFHEIKVTVDRPEVTVRTRPGYFLVAAADGSAQAAQSKTPQSSPPR
ncbi:MAG: VWA domain-containing protein [Candidatus Acidiferrales bacterium]